MVPPDRYQAEMIVDIADHFNWTYFSIFYTEGNYGENAAKLVMKAAQARGHCIHIAHMFSRKPSEKVYVNAFNEVYENRNARVIVVILEQSELPALFKVCHKIGKENHWVTVIK